MMDSDNTIELEIASMATRRPSVSLPNDEARRHVRFAWYDTPEGYPDACIHQLFESQVEQTPLATAIMFGRHRITYRDLNRRANQLAHYPAGARCDARNGRRRFGRAFARHDRRAAGHSQGRRGLCSPGPPLPACAPGVHRSRTAAPR